MTSRHGSSHAKNGQANVGWEGLVTAAATYAVQESGGSFCPARHAQHTAVVGQGLECASAPWCLANSRDVCWCRPAVCADCSVLWPAGLPLVYNEARIAAFWGKRPGELASRWTRFAAVSGEQLFLFRHQQLLGLCYVCAQAGGA